MNKSKVLLGALAGLSAGAIIGILFAPKKGRVMRQNLVRKGEYMAGTAKDKLDEFLHNVSDKLEDIKKEVF